MIFSNSATQSQLDGQEAGPLYRFELKIPLQAIQFAEFTQSLYQLGLRPRNAFPDRIINSIYFDTPALDDYLDNVAGLSRRRKTRIRWYDDDPASLALEFKIKTNKLSHKQVMPLNNPTGLIPATAASLAELRRENAGEPSLNLLYGLVPMLSVTYERQYFVLAQDLRMTIDRRQKFTRLYPTVSCRAVASSVDVVVEFKFPMQRSASFKRFLSGLPFRVFRHSKYVIGIDTAFG